MTFSTCLLVAFILTGCLNVRGDKISAADIATVQNVVSNTGSNLLGIIGGSDVVAHSYPYLVVLNLFSSSTGIFCGGTLITTKIVLTAAHCFDHNPTRVVAYMGRHDISTTESTIQRKTSRKFTVHANWNNTTLQNDIAIVTLPTAVTLNTYVQTVKIANGTDTFSGQTGSILGWGLTETGMQSYQLRIVDVEVLTDQVCSQSFSQAVSTNICTSGNGTKGGCTGDSGGPLVVDGKQVGIMSFGSTNCRAGTPSVFTRLTSYYDWLVTNVGDSSIFV